MKLILKPVQARQGIEWLRQGLALFGRAPLALTGLFGGFLFVALILMFIPVLGGLVVIAALPLLSLVMMMGSAAALRGVPVPPTLLVAPLRADALRRRRLLTLCGAYGAATVLILLLSEQLDGGRLNELQDLLARGVETQEQREQVQRLIEDPDLRTGLLLRFALTGLLSVPFWYAPALVWWGQQGVPQALFSSVVALWRSKWAFLTYLVAWLALMGVGGAALGMLLQALGAGNLISAVVMPLGLTLSVIFYVSLYFMFVQTFGATAEELSQPA